MITPKVSVILPTYNVEEYIPRCMKYLLNQTLKDIEIIFIDDCSPDNSANIIKAYNDPRIKLIRHKKNKYTAEARNSGVKTAKGEYLSFMDPDDHPDFDFLEKLYELAKANDADIAKGVMLFLPANKIRSCNGAIINNKFNFHFMMQSAIYKRSLFIDNNIKFSIDTICGQFPAIYFANKIVTREDAKYFYYKRQGSCINSEFTIEKWKKLNIEGAKFVQNFINIHEITEKDYILLTKTLILNLYQYGYLRMTTDTKAEAKPLLNMYLDDFWKAVKYKDNDNLKTYYLQLREKYA